MIPMGISLTLQPRAEGGPCHWLQSLSDETSVCLGASHNNITHIFLPIQFEFTKFLTSCTSTSIANVATVAYIFVFFADFPAGQLVRNKSILILQEWSTIYIATLLFCIFHLLICVYKHFIGRLLLQLRSFSYLVSIKMQRHIWMICFLQDFSVSL